MKNSARAELELLDQRQAATLRMFNEVARALTSTLDLQSLLALIMGKMTEFFGPERWSLLLVDEAANELYYALSAGMRSPRVDSLRVRMGEGIAGWVAQTGTPLVLEDVRADARWARFAQAYPELNLRSVICLPIRGGDQTLGVIQVYNSALERLPEYTISFLRVLCDYAAIALRNARHVQLIEQLTISDDCTGLFNARHLYTSLEKEIAALRHARVRPIQQHFSLIFMDLDHFKSINDTWGHLVGSRLLREVGELLQSAIGLRHAAFRYGGDEFVILLRGLDTADACGLATTLREQLVAQRFLASEDLDIRVTGSFGLATFPQHGGTLHDIIRSADTMMYRVKQASRDGIAVADASTHEDGAGAPPRSAPRRDR